MMFCFFIYLTAMFKRLVSQSSLKLRSMKRVSKAYDTIDTQPLTHKGYRWASRLRQWTA